MIPCDLADNLNTDGETGLQTMTFKLSFGVTSVQGERPYMEDRYYARLGDPSIFAVFDGHGGGEVSDYLLLNLPNQILNAVRNDGYTQQAFENTFIQCDKELKTFLNEIEVVEVGAVTVVAICHHETLYILNLGDSRAVINHHQQAKSLSTDHKPTDPVERKRIEATGGYIQYERVLGSLAFSRGFGDFEAKKPELGPKEQWISPVPELQAFQLEKMNYQLILATDGIWDVISNQESIEIVLPYDNPSDASLALVQEAKNRGGLDNMTALLVHISP